MEGVSGRMEGGDRGEGEQKRRGGSRGFERGSGNAPVKWPCARSTDGHCCGIAVAHAHRAWPKGSANRVAANRVATEL